MKKSIWYTLMAGFIIWFLVLILSDSYEGEGRVVFDGFFFLFLILMAYNAALKSDKNEKVIDILSDREVELRLMISNLTKALNDFHGPVELKDGKWVQKKSKQKK